MSERVQQVEGQLALQNSTGYRSSFDGPIGPYDAPFSSDEDPTFRNRNSFSQRSPFAEFTRDRFPSVGGWNSNSLTSYPRSQSVAVPPDQVNTNRDKSSSVTSVKPFWTDWIQSPTRNRNDSTETIDLSDNDKTILQDYYSTIHTVCPILLDEHDQVVSSIGRASSDFKEAFFMAVALLARPSSEGGSRSSHIEQVEKFIIDQSHDLQIAHSDVDRLALIWTELIFVIVSQYDVTRWDKSSLPVYNVIRVILDQCDHHFRMNTNIVDQQYELAWTRSAFIATISSRLRAISRGEAVDPVPASVKRQLTVNLRLLPPRTVFIAQMTDALQASLSLLPEPGKQSTKSDTYEWNRLVASNLRAWVSATGLSFEDPVVTEAKAFGELLALRCTSSLGSNRTATVGPLLNLVEAVRLSTAAFFNGDDTTCYFNPLLMYTISLATLTLLELLQCRFGDTNASTLVSEATEEMKKTLEILIARKSQLVGCLEGSRFWAEVLLEMVKERIGAHAESSGKPTSSEEDKVFDLTQLLVHGYCTPITAFVSR